MVAAQDVHNAVFLVIVHTDIRLVVVDHRLETIQMPHRHQEMQWFHGVEDGRTAFGLLLLGYCLTLVLTK